ncbi:MAG: hypothetical protein AAGC55_29690 [Myxococcota bacterium]
MLPLDRRAECYLAQGDETTTTHGMIGYGNFANIFTDWSRAQRTVTDGCRRGLSSIIASPPQHLIDDARQETWLAVGRQYLHNVQKPYSWLWKVARNAGLRLARKELGLGGDSATGLREAAPDWCDDSEAPVIERASDHGDGAAELMVAIQLAELETTLWSHFSPQEMNSCS